MSESSDGKYDTLFLLKLTQTIAAWARNDAWQYIIFMHLNV